jgi:hypothetical protein
MCPLCEREGRQCPVRERPDGRLQCECGRHGWPNAGVYQETLRRMSLTIVGREHVWTQAF